MPLPHMPVKLLPHLLHFYTRALLSQEVFSNHVIKIESRLPPSQKSMIPFSDLLITTWVTSRLYIVTLLI